MATNTNSKSLSNLIINVVKSKAAFEQMKTANPSQIKEDEFYFVEGDEATTYSFSNGSQGTFSVTPSDTNTPITINTLINGPLGVDKGGTSRAGGFNEGSLIIGQGNTLALTEASSVGSASVPIYINNNGVPSPITSYSGVANKATILETARTIGISGAVTGTATSFDGHENITIPTTAIDVSKANAGTLNIARGGTGRGGGFNEGSLIVGQGNTSALTEASSTGNSSKPIYIDSNGVPTPIGSTISAKASSAAVLDPGFTIALSDGATGSTGTNLFTGTGTATITVSAVNMSKATNTLAVNHGGTGYSTLDDHSVLVGANTNGVHMILAPSTGGAFFAQNNSTDPEFGVLPVAFGGTNSTDIYADLALIYATKTEVNGLLSAKDALVFKGAVSSHNQIVNNYSPETGSVFKITQNGTYMGQKCEVGDMLICLSDTPSTVNTASNTDWIVIQKNEDGVVTGPGSVSGGELVLFDGVSGKLIKSAAGAGYGSSTKPIYINTDGVPTPIGTSIDANASSATILQNSRTIGISGGVTGTATSFNGSSNITIPVTGINFNSQNLVISGHLSVANGGTGRAGGFDNGALLIGKGDGSAISEISGPIGSNTRPIYINNNGVPTAISNEAIIDMTAAAASVLDPGRNINVNGGVISDRATLFDGSADITIPIKEIALNGNYVDEDGDNQPVSITGVLPTNNGGTGISKAAFTKGRLIFVDGNNQKTWIDETQYASIDYGSGEQLTLGDSSSGNNVAGKLSLYSGSTAGSTISVASTSSWINHKLPASGGWIVTSGNNGSPSSKGTQYIPIYINSNGMATQVSQNQVLVALNTASSNGVNIYQESASLPVTGTLGVGNGGTGRSGNFTRFKVIYSDFTDSIDNAEGLETTGNNLAINTTIDKTLGQNNTFSVTDPYTFKVNGSSKLHGQVVMDNGDLCLYGGSTPSDTDNSTQIIFGGYTGSNNALEKYVALTATKGELVINQNDTTSTGKIVLKPNGTSYIASGKFIVNGNSIDENYKFQVNGPTFLTGGNANAPTLTVSGNAQILNDLKVEDFVTFTEDTSATINGSTKSAAFKVAGGTIFSNEDDATKHTTNGSVIILGGLNIAKTLRTGGDIILKSGNSNRSIIFGSGDETAAGSNTNGSWRLAYLEFGANFVIQTSTANNTWSDVIKAQKSTLDVYFAHSIIPLANATQTYTQNTFVIQNDSNSPWTIGTNAARWNNSYVLNSYVSQLRALDDNMFYLADSNNKRTVKINTLKGSMEITPLVDETGTLGNIGLRWNTIYVTSFAPDRTLSINQAVKSSWTTIEDTNEFSNQTGRNTTLPYDGTYIIQIYDNDSGSPSGQNSNSTSDDKMGHVATYWSGIFSWYAGATASTEYTEIPLHGSGSNMNTKSIHVRTANVNGHMVLQIKTNRGFGISGPSNTAYTIKIKYIM